MSGLGVEPVAVAEEFAGRHGVLYERRHIDVRKVEADLLAVAPKFALKLAARGILADHHFGAVGIDAKVRIEDKVEIVGVRFVQAGVDIYALSGFLALVASFGDLHGLLEIYVGFVLHDLQVVDGEVALAELIEAQNREVVVAAALGNDAVAVLHDVADHDAPEDVLGHVVVEFDPELDVHPGVRRDPLLGIEDGVRSVGGVGLHGVLSSNSGEEQFSRVGRPEREGLVGRAVHLRLEGEDEVAVFISFAPAVLEARDLVVRGVDGIEALDLDVLVGVAVHDVLLSRDAAVGRNTGAQCPAVLADQVDVGLVALEVLAEDRLKVFRFKEAHSFAGGIAVVDGGVVAGLLPCRVGLIAGLIERVAVFVGAGRETDPSDYRSGLAAVQFDLAHGIFLGGAREVSRQSYGLGLGESDLRFGEGVDPFRGLADAAVDGDVAVFLKVRQNELDRVSAQFADGFHGQGKQTVALVAGLVHDHAAGDLALHDGIGFHDHLVGAGRSVGKMQYLVVVQMVVPGIDRAVGIDDVKVKVVDQDLGGAGGRGRIGPAERDCQVKARPFLEGVGYGLVRGGEGLLEEFHLAVFGHEALPQVDLAVAFHVVRPDVGDLLELGVLSGIERAGAGDQHGFD